MAIGIVAQSGTSTAVTVLWTSGQSRRAYLGSATIWQMKELPSPEQILEGPSGIVRLDRRQANPPQGLPCTWELGGKQLRGKTEKFQCRTPAGTSVRVKYYTGNPETGNREVFAEVVATRLFWALGYGADVVFPVRVNCLECPADPMSGEGPRASRVFLGVVEPRFEGAAILSSTDLEEGWTFGELDEAIEQLGPGPERERSCQAAVATIQDLGATFGGAGRFTKDTNAKLDLSSWSGAVFKSAGNQTTGARKCEVKLVTSLSSRQLRLRNPRLRELRGGSPRIGEAGRRHLAEQLARLSDAHIRALFEAGRVDVLGEPTYTEPATGVTRRGVDAWVAAFKHKREEIRAARCTN
jgi:hypothetical protein